MRNFYTSTNNISSVQEDEETAESLMFYAVGLFGTVILIMLFGLTMLYSTSYEMAGSGYFIKQIIWAGVGFSGAVAIFLIGYKTLSDYSLILIGIIAVLLVMVFLFDPVKGAYRWIKTPVGNIQPSEYAKMVVILFVAKYCSERIRYLNSLSLKKGIIIQVVITGAVIALILIGKDLGTTILISAVVWFILFSAGVRLWVLVPPPLVLLVCGFFYIKYFDPERWGRLTVYLNPEAHAQGEGYQLLNSLMALGSGNWLGLGLTQSRLKARYLPEAHTDFILSIAGEELGFLFIGLVIIAYITFMIFAIKISLNSRTKQGMFLGFGVTMVIVLQAIINIGVVSGAIPTKGMPAPFISYGGSNLVTCLIGVGLLISIAVDSAYPGLNRQIFSALKRKLSRLSPDNWI